MLFMKKRTILPIILLASLTANAQEADKVASCSDFLKAYNASDCTITFDVNSEGEPFRVKWGMDTAWDWDYNVNRGIAHIGKGNFETGRVSFQPIDLVKDNGDGTYTLSDRQKNRLKVRVNMIKTTGTKMVNLNCDHEVLFKKVDSRGYCQDADDNTGLKNYQGKPEEWYKLIKASTQYVQSLGLEVVSVSPFNESDFIGWKQYSGSEENGMKDFLAIAKLIKADDFFKDIRVCGGNTLNCDRALPWYNALKDYLDEGNTHQLAGSFDTYASFFAKVKADGKVATGDELHNVGEAIVGAQYGMENGIWWGFDAKARGQFCLDSNEGVRIGYGEDRPHWTSGAVYRNEKTGEVHGYLGSSERQANKSTYTFVSKGKDVFFNGYGPTRHWAYELPGGTGYQKGQINAELLFDVTWGEDVAPMQEVNGTYQIMNASSKKLITFTNGSNVQSASRKTSGTTQQWNVYPSYTDGDCSYWFIDNAGNKNAHMNLLNMNLNSGAGVITYNANHGHEEQWYLKYAKDGYYYIIARLSNKYLYCSSSISGTDIKTKDAPDANTKENELKKYLWRFMPVDAKAETDAPAAPTSLSARQRPSSIELKWNAPTDEDLASFTILREVDGEWNTIAREDTLTMFVDNSVEQGKTYTYKVIAVDYSGNRSEASETITATPLAEKSLVCQLQFDKSLSDATDNHINAALNGTEKFTTTLYKSGSASIQLAGTTYLQLPYSAASHDEMTIATWVRLDNSTNNWQRLFDFGNGTDQYMFFTPSNGSEMRFVMKNGGEEQILTNGKKLASTTWKHVAVTLKPLADGKVQATLYIDGEQEAQSDEFTIKPTDINVSLSYIGRSMFSSDPLFKGRIDDFRIYNYALSADEIKAVTEDLGEVAANYKDIYEDVATTGVESIPNSNAQDANIYDLSGRQISSSPQGMYIKGNKVMIKK